MSFLLTGTASPFFFRGLVSEIEGAGAAAKAAAAAAGPLDAGLEP